jgi:hypothetical protein
METNNKIQNLLDTAIYYLETIDDSNFDYKIQKLNQIAQEIALEKKKLSFEDSGDDFLLNNNLFKDKAKLLKEKFDSIIENKKNEQVSVSVKMKHVENQKKLAIYNR